MGDKAIITIGAGDALGGAIALTDEGGILNPEHIADAYWALHVQARDAWTHELDHRPWMETW